MAPTRAAATAPHKAGLSAYSVIDPEKPMDRRVQAWDQLALHTSCFKKISPKRIRAAMLSTLVRVNVVCMILPLRMPRVLIQVIPKIVAIARTWAGDILKEPMA